MRSLQESLLDDDKELFSRTDIAAGKRPTVSKNDYIYYLQAWFFIFNQLDDEACEEYSSYQYKFVLRLFKAWMPKYYLQMPNQNEIEFKEWVKVQDDYDAGKYKNIIKNYLEKISKEDIYSMNALIDSRLKQDNVDKYTLTCIKNAFFQDLDKSNKSYINRFSEDLYRGIFESHTCWKFYGIIADKLNVVGITDL